MSARPGPGGGYHAEWYPYRDRQPTNIQCGLLHQPTSVRFASPQPAATVASILMQ